MFEMRSANPVENFVVSSIQIRGVNYSAGVENEITHLEIYESLDGLTSGIFMFTDTAGIADTLRPMGFEAVDIEFASLVGAQAHKVYKKSFRCTGITRQPSKTGGYETVMIRFTNNLITMNDYVKRPYVFKKTSISNIITAILDGLGDEVPVYDIEQSLYQRDFVTSITKPFDTIMSLVDYASTDVNNSCKFKFYEDRDGLKFKSLGTIRDQDYDFIIRKGANTGDGKWTSGEGNAITALRVVVKEQSNMHEISSGIFGARTYAHSLINKKLTTSDVRRNDYIASVGILNDTAHMYTSEDVFPSEVTESEQPLNSIQLVSHDGFYEKDTQHPLGSTHSVSIMEETYIRSKTIIVEIPGNTNMTVGEVVYMDLHSVTGENHASLDASGRWVIQELKHRVELNQFITTLELVSDSSLNVAVAGSDT
ncbi:tail protein [Vibrio phage K567]|nr:putative baseplate hub protein [Vibrio phage 6E35.1a]